MTWKPFVFRICHQDDALADHVVSLHSRLGNGHIGVRDVELMRNGIGELGFVCLDTSLQRSLSRQVRDTVHDNFHPFLEESPIYHEMKETFATEGIAGPPFGSASQNYGYIEFFYVPSMHVNCFISLLHTLHYSFQHGTILSIPSRTRVLVARRSKRTPIKTFF